MPETTPRRKPNARLSHWVRNKLPWPHSCISAKTRKVNKLISNTAGDGEPAGNIDTQHSDPPKERKGRQRRHELASMPLTLSAWACRRMMARFCSFMRRIDDTIELLGFELCAIPILISTPSLNYHRSAQGAPIAGRFSSTSPIAPRGDQSRRFRRAKTAVPPLCGRFPKPPFHRPVCSHSIWKPSPPSAIPLAPAASQSSAACRQTAAVSDDSAPGATSSSGRV